MALGARMDADGLVHYALEKLLAEAPRPAIVHDGSKTS